MVVQDRRFHWLCRKFFEAALSSLNCCLQQIDEPVYKCVDKAHFREDGGVSVESRYVPDWDILLVNHRDTLEELPEFVNLCAFVVRTELKEELLIDLRGNSIPPQSYSRWLFDFTCVPLIRSYLSAVNSLDFDEAVFGHLYQGMEEYCYSPTILLIYVAPLFYFGVKADVDNIALAPDLTIRRLTAKERSRLWSLASEVPLLSRQDTYDLRFAAEITRKTSKRELGHHFSEQFAALEVLLRLITKQPISISFVLSSQEPWFNCTGSMGSLQSWSRTRHQRLMPQSPLVLFNPSNIETLRRLWKGYTEIKNDTRLTLALNRFGSAYDEAKPEDKLLDLWIGLETLFSQGVRQELAYRIALRIAYYLGKTHTGRDTIYSRTRESYDKYRSAIVHGDRCKGDLNVITKRTENFLAASLRSCLFHRKVPTAKELDNKILKGHDCILLSE